MVVGTSAVVADPVKGLLGAMPDIDLAIEATDGIEAVSRLRRSDIDVIFIDIGDPNVKPETDLSRLMKVDPDAQIVLVATLTFGNVKAAMAALVKGAAEFIQAPARHTPHIREADFKREVQELARELGKARRRKGPRKVSKPVLVPIQPRHEHPVPTTLRPRKPHRPKVIAIASSTGGPQALFKLFGALPRIDLPVFLTQHMPAGFTQALANHIEQHCDWSCKEAEDGDLAQGGRILVAPGDFHLIAERSARGPVARINQAPEENFCRPSAEPMIRSLAEVYGAENMLLVVLTGMGTDGKAGAKLIADAGGTIVVQDKETSVVWGMPGAIAAAGDCHAILPIDQMGAFVAKAAEGG